MLCWDMEEMWETTYPENELNSEFLHDFSPLGLDHQVWVVWYESNAFQCIIPMAIIC